MKKHISLFAASFCFFAFSSLAQNGEKKSWTTPDRSKFIIECIGAAKVSMSVDSARFYCFCMMEKIEAKFPVPADADKMTTEDLNTPEMLKEIRSCITSIAWAKKDREEFITSCIDVAKANLGEAKAKTYCECMAYKVEKLYPNAADAGKLNAEELKKDIWQKIIKTCMEF